MNAAFQKQFYEVNGNLLRGWHDSWLRKQMLKPAPQAPDPNAPAAEEVSAALRSVGLELKPSGYVHSNPAAEQFINDPPVPTFTIAHRK